MALHLTLLRRRMHCWLGLQPLIGHGMGLQWPLPRSVLLPRLLQLRPVMLQIGRSLSSSCGLQGDSDWSSARWLVLSWRALCTAAADRRSLLACLTVAAGMVYNTMLAPAAAGWVAALVVEVAGPMSTMAALVAAAAHHHMATVMTATPTAPPQRATAAVMLPVVLPRTPLAPAVTAAV